MSAQPHVPVLGSGRSESNQRTGFTLVLWSSCLAMLAVGTNGTAIMTALPTMRTELVLSSAGVQWAVNAYLVVSAACIGLGGQAADRFGAARFDGRIGAVRCCVLHHRHRRRTNRAVSRAGSAGARGSVRGARHSSCDRHQRGEITRYFAEWF
jgi:hypothetical protein